MGNSYFLSPKEIGKEPWFFTRGGRTFLRTLFHHIAENCLLGASSGSQLCYLLKIKSVFCLKAFCSMLFQ